MSKSDNEHTPRLDRTSTIRIINDHPLALTLVSATAKRGAWSVGKPPVTVIEPGTDSGDMILLDKFGIHGSEGSLEYRLGSGEETIKIIFSCPLMGKNTAQWGLPELAGVQLHRPTFESAGPLSAEFTVSHPDTGT